VPPETAKVLTRMRRYREETGRNLLRDRMRAELSAGVRVVLHREHWVVYVPEAARWPVEVEAAPLRDAPDLCALNDAERAELSEIYPEIVRRLDRYFTDRDGEPMPLPYVAAWHQAPSRPHGGQFRLHLRIFSTRRAPDRLKHLAGSESGMGVWINDAVPEAIARRLRSVAR